MDNLRLQRRGCGAGNFIVLRDLAAGDAHGTHQPPVHRLQRDAAGKGDEAAIRLFEAMRLSIRFADLPYRLRLIPKL